MSDIEFQELDLVAVITRCWCNRGCANPGEMILQTGGRICRPCAAERHEVFSKTEMTTLFLRGDKIPKSTK